MNSFLQLHVLTFYPPSNLNRDDMGRPKTAEVGGSPRLRISSQCLKRSWRTSSIFQEALAGNLGTRTRHTGKNLFKRLLQGGVAEKKATQWAHMVHSKFVKCEKDSYETKQLVHISPGEQAAIDALADVLIAENRPPTEAELQLLQEETHAVDIALFGRMLADSTIHNVDAAAKVAHAFTVNRVAVEDDYFIAVDDLNVRGEDSGAAHINEGWFGSGVYYL